MIRFNEGTRTCRHVLAGSRFDYETLKRDDDFVLGMHRSALQDEVTANVQRSLEAHGQPRCQVEAADWKHFHSTERALKTFVNCKHIGTVGATYRDSSEIAGRARARRWIAICTCVFFGYCNTSVGIRPSNST